MVDLVACRVVQAHRREAAAQAAHGAETAGQRAHRRATALPGGGGAGIGHQAGDGRQRLHERRRRLRTGEPGQAGQPRIDAVEHLGVGPGDAAGQHGVAQAVAARTAGRTEALRHAGQRQQLRHALALVHAARFTGDFVAGAAEHGVVGLAAGELQQRRRPLALRPAAATRPAEAGGVVELLRLPRLQTGLDLVGERAGVCRQAERLERDPRRRLVVLAAALAVEHEADDHVGTDGADHPHVVGGDLLLAPLLERLLNAERKAEVDRAREVLLGAVELVHGGEFLGAQHRQCLEDLGADLVLAAFPARGRDERRAEAPGVPVVGQQRVVLVVGVRGGHHQVAHGVELAQRQLESGFPGHRGHRLQPVLGAGRHERRREGESDNDGEEEQSAHGNGKPQPVSVPEAAGSLQGLAGQARAEDRQRAPLAVGWTPVPTATSGGTVRRRGRGSAGAAARDGTTTHGPAGCGNGDRRPWRRRAGG